MKRRILALALVLLTVTGFSPVLADTFTIDSDHSQVMFTIRHLGIGWITGRLPSLSGDIDFQIGNLKNLNVAVDIDAARINTDVEKRDKHLRSPDFFNVEKYPKISFASKSVTNVDGGRFDLVGDLTLLGVTREVTLKAVFEGNVNDPWGKTRAAFTARTEIDRNVFGLNWNSNMSNGEKILGETVAIQIELEAVKK